MAQWLDNHILYKLFPLYFQYLPINIHSYYNIIDYIPCAVLYILMTNL